MSDRNYGYGFSALLALVESDTVVSVEGTRVQAPGLPAMIFPIDESGNRTIFIWDLLRFIAAKCDMMSGASSGRWGSARHGSFPADAFHTAALPFLTDAGERFSGEARDAGNVLRAAADVFDFG